MRSRTLWIVLGACLVATSIVMVYQWNTLQARVPCPPTCGDHAATGTGTDTAQPAPVPTTSSGSASSAPTESPYTHYVRKLMVERDTMMEELGLVYRQYIALHTTQRQLMDTIREIDQRILERQRGGYLPGLPPQDRTTHEGLDAIHKWEKANVEHEKDTKAREARQTELDANRRETVSMKTRLVSLQRMTQVIKDLTSGLENAQERGASAFQVEQEMILDEVLFLLRTLTEAKATYSETMKEIQVLQNRIRKREEAGFNPSDSRRDTSWMHANVLHQQDQLKIQLAYKKASTILQWSAQDAQIRSMKDVVLAMLQVVDPGQRQGDGEDRLQHEALALLKSIAYATSITAKHGNNNGYYEGLEPQAWQ